MRGENADLPGVASFSGRRPLTLRLCWLHRWRQLGVQAALDVWAWRGATTTAGWTLPATISLPRAGTPPPTAASASRLPAATLDAALLAHLPSAAAQRPKQRHYYAFRTGVLDGRRLRPLCANRPLFRLSMRNAVRCGPRRVYRRPCTVRGCLLPSAI